ncbi:MAG: CcdB family protein [Proteobacteria bacterium]|nr:CcdB family protein [Pseudomonadota bacterium]
MARFDIYATPGRHADSTPYLLDVQSDLLDGLDSRVVIPLRRRERFPAVPLADRLTPTLSIAGAEFILETPKMGAVPRRALGAPLLSLAAEQARVTAAMDFLFQGF